MVGVGVIVGVFVGVRVGVEVGAQVSNVTTGPCNAQCANGAGDTISKRTPVQGPPAGIGPLYEHAVPAHVNVTVGLLPRQLFEHIRAITLWPG